MRNLFNFFKEKKTEKIENIICAALYVNDGKFHHVQPCNINKGFIICGLRHACCYATAIILNKSKIENIKVIEGFLTSNNRFVDRYDALEIAKKAKQLITKTNLKMLTTDELW